jgi:hypothetical protein
LPDVVEAGGRQREERPLELRGPFFVEGGKLFADILNIRIDNIQRGCIVVLRMQHNGRRYEKVPGTMRVMWETDC